jgi:hypothetical protein
MTGYHEQRAVLRDGEADMEIEVRGGVECDDGTTGYEVTIRPCVRVAGDGVRVMRVTAETWRSWVRAVGRLR